MPKARLPSEFMQYLAAHAHPSDSEKNAAGCEHLPSLSELSRELGVSVASLREQMEVAKAIGLVDVRPRTGIRRLPYTFLPAVWQSLSYAVTVDWSYFELFADLRNHIEAIYWQEAVDKLAPEDHLTLQILVSRAWGKLRAQTIQIPHAEHRLLHLTIFNRLENPFVLGLLEAYWEVYEAVGLNLFTDYSYLEKVWSYHQQMVDSICSGRHEVGYQALIEHKDLLFQRPHKAPSK